MTALSDYCITVRSWLNRDEEDFPDTLITSFIRMAESAISRTLRCADQIDIDVAIVNVDRVLLPSDWLDLDFVRIVDGLELEFIDRTAFYRKSARSQIEYYTITGNYLIVGGPPTCAEPRSVEVSYYAAVPPLSETETWVQKKYPDLFLMACMVAASAYGVEDERAAGFGVQIEADIGAINKQHLVGKTSGSRLRRRSSRSFN